MNDLSLLFTLIFIAVTMLISARQKLGLEKDIIIGTIRAAIQLIAIGYILKFVFDAKNPFFILSMLGVMVFVATINASNKWKGLKGITWRIGIALIVAEIITMGLMLLLGIIEVKPEGIIPISGMIIGNGMVSSGLFLNRLKSELEARRDELNIYLSLGATSNQAMHKVRKDVVKTSMLPIIDSMKTVGLVQLPGMMSGMILAGASPIEAVRYQLLIMYSLTASTAIVSILLSLLVHGLVFNKEHQFKRLGQNQPHE